MEAFNSKGILFDANLFKLAEVDDLNGRLLSVFEQCVPKVDRKRVINHPRLQRL